MITNILSKRILNVNYCSNLLRNGISNNSNNNRITVLNSNNNNRFNKFYSTKKQEDTTTTTTPITPITQPIDDGLINGKESYTHMYDLLKKRLEESEKSIEEGLENDKDLQFFKNKLSYKEIYLSRHGTIALILACFVFVGTMTYFYMGKRKHILLSKQVEQHRIAIQSELDKLLIESDKLKSTNSNQLVDIIINEIIQKNQTDFKTLSKSDLNSLKLKLIQSVNNQK